MGLHVTTWSRVIDQKQRWKPQKLYSKNNKETIHAHLQCSPHYIHCTNAWIPERNFVVDVEAIREVPSWPPHSTTSDFLLLRLVVTKKGDTHRVNEATFCGKFQQALFLLLPKICLQVQDCMGVAILKIGCFQIKQADDVIWGLIIANRLRSVVSHKNIVTCPGFRDE
jgi:hypothetical protein